MAENNLDNLITYIGIEVYGREMRSHIQNALRLLAQSSLTAEEKAKIAASISYVPQTLTDDQKQIARNNIGAAKAGDSGRGWTEEQIGLFEQFKTQLATVFERIGYKDNSAEGPGQQAANAAIEKLEDLIESLRAVPVELLSITLALKEGVSPIAGQNITSNELVVTGHYSDDVDRVIESGYTIDHATWDYPSTTVKVTYNGLTSNPITVEVARKPEAYISIDNASDTDHLVVTVGLGGSSISVSKGNPYPVYDVDMDKRVDVVIQVNSTQSGKYVIDDSTEVTMVDGEMSKTGMGIYSATSITGDIVIKAISKALPQSIVADYDGTVMQYNASLDDLKDHLTVTGTYYDGQEITLNNDQYTLSVAGGTLAPGTNEVTVNGQDEFSGKTGKFDVEVAAPAAETIYAEGRRNLTTSQVAPFSLTCYTDLNKEHQTEKDFTTTPEKIVLEYVAGSTTDSLFGKVTSLTLERTGNVWVITNAVVNNGGQTVVYGTDPRATVTYANKSVTINSISGITANGQLPKIGGGTSSGGIVEYIIKVYKNKS